MVHKSGTYQKKKNGPWYAYTDFRGKRYYVSGSYPTPDEAQSARDAYKRELKAGVTDKRNLTTLEFIQLFFKDYACTWAKLSKECAEGRIRLYIYPHIQNKCDFPLAFTPLKG